VSGSRFAGGNARFNLPSQNLHDSGDSAVPKVPETVSYGALLVVINERLKLPRTLEEQKYFVDLANQLIKLYWQQLDEDQNKGWRQGA
jgi:hypothetical protein